MLKYFDKVFGQDLEELESFPRFIDFVLDCIEQKGNKKLFFHLPFSPQFLC